MVAGRIGRPGPLARRTLASEFTALIRPRLERCFEDLDGDEEELMNRLSNMRSH